MTEINGLTQSQDNAAVPLNETVTSNERVAEASPEKVFTQSEVNEIVKKVKHGAIQDYRRLQTAQPQYAAEKYDDSSLNQSSKFSDDYIRQVAEQATIKHIDKVRQEAIERTQQEAAQRVVNNFWEKAASGKDKYSDFEAVARDIPYEVLPNVVGLLSEHIDNVDDIIYEIGRNGLTKAASIEMLASAERAQGKQPSAALRELKRLAQSLKDNNDSKNIRAPNEPLSQMRPSVSGTDSGAMSVSDYRKKYRI